MVIFSLITCFPSLTRHSQTGSQADKICHYLLGVSTINSVVSSQRLYNLSPQLQHPLLPLGNIPQYLSGWERIVSYQPADTTIFNVEIHVLYRITFVYRSLLESLSGILRHAAGSS